MLGLQPIPNFKGKQFPRNSGDHGVQTQDYITASTVYATSSDQKDHDMNPGLVVAPVDGGDIQIAIAYAKANNAAISIKSGGHQYSGACSTDQANIMMDLSLTFRGDAGSEDKKVLSNKPGAAKVKVSVSWALKEFLLFLKDNHMFVPTGQCAYVHVGGHAQTGGYGQLGRSFGLFGDNITKIYMYDHEGIPRVVDKTVDEDKELFYGITGGSPGNFGVITHYEVGVFNDSDYIFNGPNGKVMSHALRLIFPYAPETLTKLLSQLSSMSDDLNYDHNYDYCVSVFSSTFEWNKLGMGPEHQPDIPTGKNPGDHEFTWAGLLHDAEDMAINAGELLAAMAGLTLKAVIVVYAQWVPKTKDDKVNLNFFKALKDVAHLKLTTEYTDKPESECSHLWIFDRHREFDKPYVKRTYTTKSTNTSKWVPDVVERIDLVINKKYKNTDLWKNGFLSCQIQNFGGNESRFYTNRDNGTSYSFRDTTICATIDCFYDGDRSVAENWQLGNDKIMWGPGSHFSAGADRRVLWGSYGDWDMSKVWQNYYDDQEKYDHIGRIRYTADPNGTFTPNVFSAHRIPN